MAQPKLDAISVKLSKKIGDEVSSASADGAGGITAAMRLTFINDARNALYFERLLKLGISGFMQLFPEFVQSKVLLGEDSYVLSSDIKLVLSASLYVDDPGVSHILNEVEPVKYQEASLNPFSTYLTNDSYKLYSVFDNRMNLLPNVVSEFDSITAICLMQPVAVVQGGSNPDIFEPDNWIPDITEAAYKQYLSTIQSGGN